MAAGAMIAPTDEETAVGGCREIFAEIKSAMGLAAVPEIFRIMAHLPLYIETGWQRFKFAFLEDGELDTRTKWMIGLTGSTARPETRGAPAQAARRRRNRYAGPP